MIGDRVDVLAPRSRTKNEGSAGNPNAIASRGADIDHGGIFEIGNIRVPLYSFDCRLIVSTSVATATINYEIRYSLASLSALPALLGLLASFE